MNREEYIARLVKLAGMKWHLNATELEELRLALEMIPDRCVQYVPETVQPIVVPPITPPRSPWPNPWDSSPVMYGVQPPNIIYGCRCTSITNKQYIKPEDQNKQQGPYQTAEQ